MLVLLAAIPYAVAIVSNWLTVGQTFKPGTSRGVEPGSWSTALLVPVAIGGLTPIALAARKGVSSYDRGLLGLSVALSIAFAVVTMVTLADPDRALKLQNDVTIGRMNLPWLPRWRLVLIIGSLLLVFGAVTNVIVAGN
jgi:NO-binding membrane sensor protein with MHYT domain